MSGKPKAVFCLSSGKDSALALMRVIKEGVYDIRYLLTTLNYNFKRISMHGIREELLDLQATSIGIPLLKVWVSKGTNEEYEERMELVLKELKSEGIEFVIFGDIFLEDLREYRERNLAKIGLKAIFPLWKESTGLLIREFIDSQFQAVICCTNDNYLGDKWLGRNIDQSFISELPDNVDPCGENGEYHTFCYAGPVFKNPIQFITGEKIFQPIDTKLNDRSIPEIAAVTPGFWYCDLIPAE